MPARTPPFPASILVLAGTPQSTTVNTAFASPLQVVVKDEYGVGFPNALVTFTAPSAGPSLSKATTSVTTDGNGIASLNVMANAVSGSYEVNVLTNGLGGSPMTAIFALTNNGGAPAATSRQTASVVLRA